MLKLEFEKNKTEKFGEVVVEYRLIDDENEQVFAGTVITYDDDDDLEEVLLIVLRKFLRL